jgi:hypothetical protein
MEAFSVTIPQFVGAIPPDAVSAQLQLSAVPDLLAGLGVLIVATIGLLALRHLKELDDRPAESTPAPQPKGDGLRKAA